MTPKSILAASRHIQEANRALRDAGLRISARQLAVLSVVADREAPPATMRTIGEALDVTPAVVTGVIDRLERIGALERRKPLAIGDRRTVRLVITGAGASMLLAARDALDRGAA